MSVSKTIRSELIKKIGQRIMYSKMDKVRKMASHSITSDTAVHIVASQEDIPVVKILKKEQKTEEMKEIQDTIQHAITEELGKVLEMFQTLNIGKTNQVKK